MKKQHTLVLTVVLSMGLLAAPLNAAIVKAGAKCSKAKAVSIYKGTKFTCIKSGNKLIWNKGVKITASKPDSGTAAGTTSPAPDVKPTQSALVPVPTSPEIEKLDLLIADALKSAKPINAVVDIQVGPGKEVAILGEIAKDSLDSALLISGILGIEFSKPVKVYIGSRDWLLPKMPAGTWCVDPVIGVPGTGSGGFCGLDNGVIFVNLDGYLSEPGSSKRDFTKNPDKILVSFGFVHEMVHWMQGEAAIRYANKKGFYNSYWLNEGGANFGAMMAQAYLYKMPFSKIRTYIATYSNCIGINEMIKVKDYITNNGPTNNCGPYYAGYLWTEYLVAKTGDVGSLVNLAKQGEKFDREVIWNPEKVEEYNEKRLALSLKYQYGIEYEEFVKGAEEYSRDASAALAKWSRANPTYWPSN